MVISDSNKVGYFTANGEECKIGGETNENRIKIDYLGNNKTK